MVITDEIVKIKDIIVDTIPLEKLYLFGSYAYGTPDEDSDYDFYAVIPNGSMRPLAAIQKIYGATWGINRKPMDVLAGTVEIFERRSKLLTLKKTIAEKGVLLYGCMIETNDDLEREWYRFALMDLNAAKH